MVGTTIITIITTLTGYIPSALRNTHHHDHALPSVEWSVLYTAAYNAQVHPSNVNTNPHHQGVASAFHGKTQTMGGRYVYASIC